MKLILVRHGETVWNAEGRTQGFSDVELTEVGRRQAQLVGKSLAAENVAAVYSSDLKRAVETARAIAQHHALETVPDTDLRELNQGILEGLTFQELRDNHAGYLKEWGSSPATAVMPGGESMAGLQQRTWRAVERFVERHSQDTIVAVSHNLAILSILCKVLDLDLNRFRGLKQDVAAKNVVEFGPRGFTVSCMNDTSHLRPELISPRTPVLEVIERRRSIRHMKDTPIPEDHLNSILEAARLAPSWANRQCWRFVVVRDPDTKAILSDAIRAPKSLILEAPLTIVACAYPDQSGRREGLDYFMLDMGIAVEHLVLQAAALGLGTCWIGLFEEEKIRKVIGVPDDMRVVALVPVGYPDQDPKPRPRKAMEEIVFEERLS